MGVLNSLIYALSVADSVNGPGIIDQRPTTVTIQVRQYAAGFRSSQGSYTVVSTLALPPYVKVRLVTTREIADSGGRYDRDDVIVGPIRPTFTAPDGTPGGFTQAQIDPAPSLIQNASTNQGTDVVYVLAQENGPLSGLAGEYSLVEFRHFHARHYHIVLSRRMTTT